MTVRIKCTRQWNILDTERTQISLSLQSLSPHVRPHARTDPPNDFEQYNSPPEPRPTPLFAWWWLYVPAVLDLYHFVCVRVFVAADSGVHCPFVRSRTNQPMGIKVTRQNEVIKLDGGKKTLRKQRPTHSNHHGRRLFRAYLDTDGREFRAARLS